MKSLLIFILCGGWIFIGFLAILIGAINQDSRTIYMGATMIGFSTVCLAATLPKKKKVIKKNRKK